MRYLDSDKHELADALWQGIKYLTEQEKLALLRDEQKRVAEKIYELAKIDLWSDREQATCYTVFENNPKMFEEERI